MCEVELGKRLYFVCRQSRFIMFYLLELLRCNIQHLQFEINLKQFNEWVFSLFSGFGLGNRIDLDIGELELGELGHVCLSIAAKLLGNTVQFVL